METQQTTGLGGKHGTSCLPSVLEEDAWRGRYLMGWDKITNQRPKLGVFFVPSFVVF